MSRIAVIGAGGKMGCRIMDNLAKGGHELVPVEVGAAGIARLAERGRTPVPAADAVPTADAVVLAVPDDRIGQVARELVPLGGAGAMFVVLDAAAPYAGLMPARADVTYIVTHPCHPALFDDRSAHSQPRLLWWRCCAAGRRLRANAGTRGGLRARSRAGERLVRARQEGPPGDGGTAHPAGACTL